MLNQAFTAMLITSCAGTALSLLLILIKPLTKRFFGYLWHYYIWLGVLLVMVLPVRLPVSQHQTFEPVVQLETAHTTSEAPIVAAQVPQNIIAEVGHTITDYFDLLGYVWIIGAALSLFSLVFGYIRLIIRLRRRSVITDCPMLSCYTARKITTLRCSGLSSPFMMGVFRPIIVLPEGELTDNQLENILRHELTHFMRKDILYKWFAAIVRCLHWFNPIAYYLSHEINIECEISCDLSVVSKMNSQEEQNYIDTILSLLTKGKASLLSTGMAGSRNILKRRFTMIKNKKQTSKAAVIFSAVFAAIILSASLLSSGALASSVADSSDITFIADGKTVHFDNKPFYMNSRVYLPLREAVERIGGGNVEWDNGKIYADIPSDMPAYYMVEIGSSKLAVSNKAPFNNRSNDVKLAISFPLPAVLKNDSAYVPFEFIDYMLYHGKASDKTSLVCFSNGEAQFLCTAPSLVFPTESRTITQGFGERVHPFTGEKTAHNGIDIAANEGESVFASFRGVAEVGYDSQMGNFVIISDGSISALYGHLSSVKISEGDVVPQNTVIGTVGRTGNATGSFLHFEIMAEGEYLDPQKAWESTWIASR